MIPSFSESGNDQTYIDTLEQRPPIGTRGLGLSRAFVSGADDATSPLWNPAGLASLNHGNIIYDLSQGALSIAYPVKSVGTFGINLLDFNTSDRFLINEFSNPIGTFEYGYNQALLSYARKLGPIRIGVSTGFSRSPYQNSLWAQNYDLGAMIALSQQAIVGMQFRDINGVSIQDENGFILNRYNSQMAFGTTLIPHKHIKWHACYSVTTPSFGTSLEIVTGSLSANVGSHFSFDAGAFAQSWSLGLSLNRWGKQTYYTFLNQEDLDYKHLLSIGFTFGDTTQASSEKTHGHNDTTKDYVASHDAESDIRSTHPTTQPRTPDNPTHQKTEPTQNTSKKKSIQIAERYSISLELMLAIIYVESKFNPVAVSKTGAGGLMQMIPSTAREYSLKVPKYTNRLKPNLDGKVDERFDAQKNLEAGLEYFNFLLNKYLNNLTLALGAYNVGPGRVKIRGPLSSRGRVYAEKVLTRQQLYRSDGKLLETDLKRLEIILNE